MLPIGLASSGRAITCARPPSLQRPTDSSISARTQTDSFAVRRTLAIPTIPGLPDVVSSRGRGHPSRVAAGQRASGAGPTPVGPCPPTAPLRTRHRSVAENPPICHWRLARSDPFSEDRPKSASKVRTDQVVEILDKETTSMQAGMVPHRGGERLDSGAVATVPGKWNTPSALAAAEAIAVRPGVTPSSRGGGMD